LSEIGVIFFSPTHLKKTNKKEGRDRKEGLKKRNRWAGHESWTTNMDAVLLGGVGVINFNLIF
jgi:hypothetical protein